VTHWRTQALAIGVHLQFVFETRSRYVAMACLKLEIILPHPAGILGMHHHVWLIGLF
jgi:hypothetical protein